MPQKFNNSIRSRLMLQSIFFALVLFSFTSIAIWQLYSVTQSYSNSAKKNDALQLAAGQAITSAKQMDWLIQRILLSQYSGNFSRIIARQGELLENMADFEMFIKAINWGSESSVFKNADDGRHYQRWLDQGWDKRIVLSDMPDSVRQYAGTAHLYYSAFIRYTSGIITHAQGYLNAIAAGDRAGAERDLALANAANKKVERFENLGSAALYQLIELTHQLNQESLRELHQNFKSSLSGMAFWGLVLLTLLLIINRLVFTQMIAKPLELLTSVISRVDTDSLSLSIPPSGTSEVMGLITKFNELITHLRNTTVKRDALLEEIESHKLTTEKLLLANQALKANQLELTSTLATLKKSNEDLHQTHLQLMESAKMESVGRLAAGVAHEVKNPLCIIQMGLDYLHSQVELKTSAAVNREIIEDMVKAVERACKIIQGLLNFSAPHDLTMEKHNMNEVIEETLLFLKHLLSSHHAQIVKSLDPNLPMITMDKQKLHQVLINLLMNAAHAMPATGTLTITTHVEKKCAAVTRTPPLMKTILLLSKSWTRERGLARMR